MEINNCNLINIYPEYTDVYHFVGGNVLLDREAAATLMCFVASIKFDDTTTKGFQFISKYELNA